MKGMIGLLGTFKELSLTVILSPAGTGCAGIPSLSPYSVMQALGVGLGARKYIKQLYKTLLLYALS